MRVGVTRTKIPSGVGLPDGVRLAPLGDACPYSFIETGIVISVLTLEVFIVAAVRIPLIASIVRVRPERA
jgi:hypothetical protein